MTFRLGSTAFTHNETIPALHTCDGRDLSPPLIWTEPPAGTRSLVLIVDDPDAPDPDAPKMTWTHWVLYNLPPTAGILPEGVQDNALPPGTLQGLNDWQRTGYGGPCPPIGNHRYFHKLYALDKTLPDMRRPTKAMLIHSMDGHILAQAELIGRYQRHRQAR
ncbi:YbhB/YbcL family Raf kinase inhibitor-like protein [Metapseudomonas lalkuanensis]|uniref:YbhB/YbcL family Raf kinase inhibitor-like protein n=1 Tax=Metapseudomonas lalkuanensis TaxID=2604832 RepID=A0A5J6QJN5_9GAMM|nr:YbhB/YbcL family Raf kinase inhibitor-like protein [Pseudomonas lalkuanensis]QEY61995.1 YbhB/YbcL family Raf kinase inhibitor-like protein [Pseudomonas lalkuanensis]UCO99776.1 YbhB/YbcL family Raf kinase inhibitor-like protein [Pseudomonas lalkuanensis]